MNFKGDSFSVIGLSELMDIQGGAQPPACTFKDALEPGYVRFVQIRDFETDAHLTYIQQLPKWRYCSVEDVLIARYGASVGRICRGVAGAYNVALAKVIPKGGVELGYLYYLLRSEFFQGPIAAMSGRSAQAGFNKDDLAAIRVPVAPLKDQREIAALLRCFDDRITLLRETNATLEAIAQALFKSWFVDFDPVRAKMEGRVPEGMDEATAALFPDSFEETELGEVPWGWTVGTLSKLMSLHRGTVTPGLLPDTEFQHFSLPAFDEGQMPVVELGSAIRSNKTTVPVDAVLLSKLNPHIPRIWLPSNIGGNAVCSTEFLPFVPCGSGTTTFIYCMLAAPYFSKTLAQLVTGTSNSHQRIKPEGVLSLTNVIPSPDVIAAFDQIADALFGRLKANREEVVSLANMRDSLLPRLISGHLRLPAAQDLAEDTV